MSEGRTVYTNPDFPEYKELRKKCVVAVLAIGVLLMLQLMSKDIKNFIHGAKNSQGEAAGVNSQAFSNTQDSQNTLQEAQNTANNQTPPVNTNTNSEVGLVTDITEAQLNAEFQRKLGTSANGQKANIKLATNKLIVTIVDAQNQTVALTFSPSQDKKSLELTGFSPDNLTGSAITPEIKQKFSDIVSAAVMDLIGQFTGGKTISSIEILNQKLTIVYS